MYITHLTEKNYTFSNQTKKGCDLVPLMHISSEAAHFLKKLVRKIADQSRSRSW